MNFTGNLFSVIPEYILPLQEVLLLNWKHTFAINSRYFRIYLWVYSEFSIPSVSHCFLVLDGNEMLNLISGAHLTISDIILCLYLQVQLFGNPLFTPEILVSFPRRRYRINYYSLAVAYELSPSLYAVAFSAWSGGSYTTFSFFILSFVTLS